MSSLSIAEFYSDISSFNFFFEIGEFSDLCLLSTLSYSRLASEFAALISIFNLILSLSSSLLVSVG